MAKLYKEWIWPLVVTIAIGTVIIVWTFYKVANGE